MKTTIYLIIAVLLLVILSRIDKFGIVVKRKLPSGKDFPEDRELLILCVDQLMTDFSGEDLSAIVEYAEEKLESLENQEEKTKWEDLIRRVNDARQDYPA